MNTRERSTKGMLKDLKASPLQIAKPVNAMKQKDRTAIEERKQMIEARKVVKERQERRIDKNRSERELEKRGLAHSCKKSTKVEVKNFDCDFDKELNFSEVEKNKIAEEFLR